MSKMVPLTETQRQLAAAHVNYAARVAINLSNPRRPSATQDERVAAAIASTVDAARTYRPEVGCPFRLWVARKVRYALRERKRSEYTPLGYREPNAGPPPEIHSASDPEIADLLVVHEDDSPEVSAEVRREAEWLVELLNGYPRVVAELVHLEGQTLEQAAATLGLSLPVVEWHHKQGLERIRAAVTGPGFVRLTGRTACACSTP